ncbi:DUF5930 domain-containing protein [Pikeienuella sp. HZG-20]|uniref:DUF5930 domain-containing protein n=1 Tax=Paludibacillus litoralis TaxID=3133267 RepID=UPI0030EBF782
MLQRLSEGVNRRLTPLFPERRLILRSEVSTRYLRASPLMQASAAALVAGFIGWTGFASVKLAETALRASAATEMLAVSEAVYESRIAGLTEEAARAAEAQAAAESAARLSIARLSQQHAALTDAMVSEREIASRLEAEESRFADLAEEHDAALTLCEATGDRVAALETALAEKSAESDARGDMLAALNATLGDVADARDDADQTKQSLALQIDELSAEISDRAAQQDRLLSQLEDAATLSLGSLQGVFEKSGVELDAILNAVRREQGGAGGPFIPMEEIEALSVSEADAPRLAALMEDLERVNLMRIAAEKMPFGRPVGAARLTSTFGYRRDPLNRRGARHTGLDLAGRRGQPIMATAPGRVTFAGWRRGYGKVVEIEHAFGYETVYAHLSKTRVKVGAHVERGDRVGDMGSTGRSTGNHVHYEVRIDGAPVNPAKYIEAARNVL